MSAPVPPPSLPAPTWARRVPGWSLLAFFLTLALLTALAASFNVIEQMEVTGYFAAAASTVPLLLLVLAYYLRPIWAIQVPRDEAAVAAAAGPVLARRGAAPSDARKGPFVRCSAVLRMDRPSCAVGWFRLTAPGRGTAGPPRTLLVLQGRAHDREELDALRSSLTEALLHPANGP